MCMQAVFQPISKALGLSGAAEVAAPVIQQAIEPIAAKQQSEKNPDAEPIRQANKARMTGGMGAGPNSTFLTGSPTGVDPTALSLGKTTLLGG